MRDLVLSCDHARSKHIDLFVGAKLGEARHFLHGGNCTHFVFKLARVGSVNQVAVSLACRR